MNFFLPILPFEQPSLLVLYLAFPTYRDMKSEVRVTDHRLMRQRVSETCQIADEILKTPA